MKDSKSNSIGFVGALQIVFIVLKLINKIEWSWWLVFSPTWITGLIAILLIVIFIIKISR